MNTMDISVRLATQADVDAVAQLYDELNAYLAAHVNYPGWKRDVYPVREDAQQGLDAGELYVAERAGEIVGTVICLHEQGAVYQTVAWAVAWDVSAIVLHIVAVHPRAFGTGVGEALMTHVERLARAEGRRVIRLDTYEKNMPAARLYERCGFAFRGMVDLGIEGSTGLKWFRAYEKVL